MAQRPSISHRQSPKPSKLLRIVALGVAFSLPYFLVTHFSHHHHKEPQLSQSLSLPELKKIVEPPPIAKSNPSPILVKEKPIAVVKTVKMVKDNEWQTIKPRPGDSMAAIFNRLGLSAKNLIEVLHKNPHAKVLTSIKPNQQLQFLINKGQLEKLIIPVNIVDTLTISRAGSVYKTQITSKKTTAHNHYVTATVRGSLYSTAQKLNIPSKLIKRMTEIFNKEIDFAHSIRSGDQFSIIYDAQYVENKMVGIGDIVAVTFRNKGKTFQAIRHINAHGDQDFFTPQGESLKKAFTRYPIKFSHISSTFATSRYHPILHYKREHKGIDLAAPIGTPIQSTGDGVVESIGRHNGYGNMIKIKHDKTYSTVYGHMLKFQKGLSRGSKVRRGQVIGYVGQTGLATGPHCHYELHVRNQPRNPSTTGLPTAAPVAAREMRSFKAKAGTLLAQLKLFEQGNFASRAKMNTHIG